MSTPLQGCSDYDVICAMRRYGGVFMEALAEAAIRADSVNLGLIKQTWPDDWSRFAELAKNGRRG
jgi:hypothetical protein